MAKTIPTDQPFTAKLNWSISIPLRPRTPHILFPPASIMCTFPAFPPYLGDLNPLFVSNWIAFTRFYDQTYTFVIHWPGGGWNKNSRPANPP